MGTQNSSSSGLSFNHNNVYKDGYLEALKVPNPNRLANKSIVNTNININQNGNGNRHIRNRSHTCLPRNFEARPGYDNKNRQNKSPISKMNHENPKDVIGSRCEYDFEKIFGRIDTTRAIGDDRRSYIQALDSRYSRNQQDFPNRQHLRSLNQHFDDYDEEINPVSGKSRGKSHVNLLNPRKNEKAIERTRKRGGYSFHEVAIDQEMCSQIDPSIREGLSHYRQQVSMKKQVNKKVPTSQFSSKSKLLQLEKEVLALKSQIAIERADKKDKKDRKTPNDNSKLIECMQFVEQDIVEDKSHFKIEIKQCKKIRGDRNSNIKITQCVDVSVSGIGLSKRQLKIEDILDEKINGKINRQRHSKSWFRNQRLLSNGCSSATEDWHEKKDYQEMEINWELAERNASKSDSKAKSVEQQFLSTEPILQEKLNQDFVKLKQGQPIKVLKTHKSSVYFELSNTEQVFQKENLQNKVEENYITHPKSNHRVK